MFDSIWIYLLSVSVLILANIYEAGVNIYYGWLYPILPSVSTCPDDSLNSWQNYTLLPAIFRNAGYDVTFLSNQFALHYNDIWNHWTETIFNKPEFSEIQFTFHNMDVFDYNGDLLQLLPDISNLTTKPNFLIVHLIGQYVSYEQRYPDSLAVYQPEQTQTTSGGEYAKKIVADYDNSLRYNDSVINQLINYIKPLNAIL